MPKLIKPLFVLSGILGIVALAAAVLWLLNFQAAVLGITFWVSGILAGVAFFIALSVGDQEKKRKNKEANTIKWWHLLLEKTEGSPQLAILVNLADNPLIGCEAVVLAERLLSTNGVSHDPKTLRKVICHSAFLPRIQDLAGKKLLEHEECAEDDVLLVMDYLSNLQKEARAKFLVLTKPEDLANRIHRA